MKPTYRPLHSFIALWMHALRNVVPILLVMGASANTLLAQKPLERTGVYTMQLSRTSTMEATETLCIEQARLATIAKEFGVAVSETTVQNTTDINGQANSQFAVLTRTAVKGEWVSDTDAPLVEWSCENNSLWVKATVKGYIRALAKEGKTEIAFYTCSPHEPNTEKVVFREGESINAYYKASQDGYLSAYYIDHTAGTVSRLFPAATGQSLDHAEVSADKEYILFNRAKAMGYNWSNSTTEVQLFLPDGQRMVTDELVVVYSSEPYQKPMLQILAHTAALAELTIVEFETWATELKFRQPKAQVKRVSITLTK